MISFELTQEVSEDIIRRLQGPVQLLSKDSYVPRVDVKFLQCLMANINRRFESEIYKDNNKE